MRTVQLILAAAFAVYASPAFAGAAIYHVNRDDDCACDAPLPRVIYGVAPVPVAPAYRVDQGPSFDLPATGYARPRVYSTAPDEYPYVDAGYPSVDRPAEGYGYEGMGYGPAYGVYGGTYLYQGRRHRHHWERPERWRDGAVKPNPPRTQPTPTTRLAPPRMAAPVRGPTSLTVPGGTAHARPAGPLAGGPGTHLRSPAMTHPPVIVRPASDAGRR